MTKCYAVACRNHPKHGSPTWASDRVECSERKTRISPDGKVEDSSLCHGFHPCTGCEKCRVTLSRYELAAVAPNHRVFQQEGSRGQDYVFPEIDAQPTRPPDELVGELATRLEEEHLSEGA